MRRPDIEEAGVIKRFLLGTKFQKDIRVFRYGLAGTDLKAGKRAYAHFPTIAGPPWNVEEMTRAFWGDLRSKASKGSRLAGIPCVDVCRGQYCWFLAKM